MNELHESNAAYRLDPAVATAVSRSIKRSELSILGEEQYREYRRLLPAAMEFSREDETDLRDAVELLAFLEESELCTPHPLALLKSLNLRRAGAGFQLHARDFPPR